MADATCAGYEHDGHFIPEHMVEGLDLYINHGIEPGSFLMAVLCNDLMESCARADHVNIHALPAFCGYLYNHAPPQCYGSRQKVQAWITTKHVSGLKGSLLNPQREVTDDDGTIRRL